MYNLIIRPLPLPIDPEKMRRILLNWLEVCRYLLPVRTCVKGHYQVDELFSHGSLRFKDRTGLSAGFDKNTEAFDGLADFGFGFLEARTVTPDYQPGSSSPHVFRLAEDGSLISRTGLNNCDVDVALEHIRKYRKRSYRLGINTNKSPLSAGEQITEDFELVSTHLYEGVDYFMLNQGSIDKEPPARVLESLTTFRQAVSERCSIFIKLPADIDGKALGLVISLAYKYSIEGFIAMGPMTDCSELHHTKAKQLEKIGNGGVNGRGVGKKSQKAVCYLSGRADHHSLIIGAGGIMTVEDAADMTSQRADTIQTYLAFIYPGPSVVHKIRKKLKHQSI